MIERAILAALDDYLDEHSPSVALERCEAMLRNRCPGQAMCKKVREALKTLVPDHEVSSSGLSWRSLAEPWCR